MHDLSSTTKLDSYPRSLYFLDTEEHLGAHLRLACTATHVTVYFGGELNDGNLADPRERGEATVRTFRVLGTELVPLSQLQEEGGETAAAEEADGELFQLRRASQTCAPCTSSSPSIRGISTSETTEGARYFSAPSRARAAPSRSSSSSTAPARRSRTRTGARLSTQPRRPATHHLPRCLTR